MITAEQFGFVSTLVRRDAAIVLEPGKEYLVEARLLPLARASGLTDAGAYVDALIRQGDAKSRQAVVEAMTTNETSWFRDNAPFEAVGLLAAEAVSNRTTDKTFRVWTAACSSGQEPYSIAMTLHEKLRDAGWRLEIIATDISTEMVDRASAGIYSQLEMNRGLPAQMLVKWFDRKGTGWQVKDELRSLMRFSKINLASMSLPGGKFDAIFIRNVLIYFDAGTKRQILRTAAPGLRPGGSLFLGAAETTMGIDDSWERCPVGRSFVYKLRSSSPATTGR